MPDEIVQQVNAAWLDSRIDPTIIDGWSHDWTKFDCIWEWLLPLSRWGALDRDFLDETVGTIVRHRLQSVGEIIPVLYREDNHHEVLFRIGQRLYYSRRRREWEDRADFEMNEMGRLGVLPFSYDQFLVDPTEAIFSATIYNNQTNLASWEGSEALLLQLMIAFDAYERLDSIEAGTLAGLRSQTW